VAISPWPGRGHAIARAAEIPRFPRGRPLSEVCPEEKPVDSLVIAEISVLLARLARVRKSRLPALPPDWPRNEKDSKAFLEALAGRTHRMLGRNWFHLGGLFAALGMPGDGLTRFVTGVPSMTHRPYSLLHTALGRDKVFVVEGAQLSVTCHDWTAATYGDPLYGLVSHLVRMRYPQWQWEDVISAWAWNMERTKPAALAGFRKDLPHYLGFERICSAYGAVIVAARWNDDERTGEAAMYVRDALEAAADPLRLADVPDSVEIARALRRWQLARVARWGGTMPRTPFLWERDERVPEHPAFPFAAVSSALAEEGAAPPGRVFTGTAHLNTVVEVPGCERPVVVRRRVHGRRRLERSFLAEHVVLTTLERSQAQVSAPRVLAMGYSDGGDPFVIHTYEGPHRGDVPPTHPVNGLLPYEADQLVDQLAELTSVDYSGLDPAPSPLDFYGWLVEELVMLVRGLAPEARRLARAWGLPDHLRLRELLSRHTVSVRARALLHGDLNPWNLVRREGSGGGLLTLIDWEMAMVGDPLYDLVRHMHLTPTRPEIRDRMFRRWERTLPALHTRDWRQDWRAYRWIEIVRSAYVDLDRLVTGAGHDAPNVQRALESYAMTLADATAVLGLRPRGRQTLTPPTPPSPPPPAPR
jgi:aminoglycoside phosphotransferase (APT) family kinase protein